MKTLLFIVFLSDFSCNIEAFLIVLNKGHSNIVIASFKVTRKWRTAQDTAALAEWATGTVKITFSFIASKRLFLIYNIRNDYDV